MRHGDKQNNLGRKKAHRDALLSNLAAQLITHKRIVTTLAKAKELRKYVEPLITKTKKNASEAQISHNHRLVFSFLQNKTAVKELFTVVGPKIGDRPGGYTRIIKLGIRPGDNGEKAMIELVDFNEVYGKSAAAGENQEAAKRTRRSRSAAKKATDATTASAEPTTASAIEDVEVVEEKAPEAPVAESAPEAPATEAEAPKADDAVGESTEEAAK